MGTGTKMGCITYGGGSIVGGGCHCAGFVHRGGGGPTGFGRQRGGDSGFFHGRPGGDIGRRGGERRPGDSGFCRPGGDIGRRGGEGRVDLGGEGRRGIFHCGGVFAGEGRRGIAGERRRGEGGRAMRECSMRMAAGGPATTRVAAQDLGSVSARMCMSSSSSCWFTASWARVALYASTSAVRESAAHLLLSVVVLHLS